MRIPKSGDYLQFHQKYHLLSINVVLDPGTMCKIMRVLYREHSSGFSEEVDCILILAVQTKDSLKFIKLNYGFYADKTSIIPAGKATKLLYDK